MRRVLGFFLLTAGVLTASRGEIELATQGCWKKLNGKAQVAWYGHLRTIDEYDRAERVRTSTPMAVTAVSRRTRVPGGPIQASGGLLTSS